MYSKFSKVSELIVSGGANIQYGGPKLRCPGVDPSHRRDAPDCVWSEGNVLITLAQLGSTLCDSS